MCRCFHCGEETVVWDCNFDFQDLDYEGEGVVHFLHCTSCGARIEYTVGEYYNNDDVAEAEIGTV